MAISHPNVFHRILWALAFGVLAKSAAWSAQNDKAHAGAVAASFLAVDPSVRVSALGGFQAAAAGDFQASFSNPAALTSLAVPELWLAHNESFIDTRFSTLGYAGVFRGQGLSVALEHISHGTADRTGMDGSGQPLTDLGSFKFATTLMYAGWSRPLATDGWAQKWSAGANLKLWQDGQDGDEQRGMASDVGLQARGLWPATDVGAVIRNLGPSVDGHALPRSVAVGGVYHVVPRSKALQRASLFSELEWSSYVDPVLRLGVELDQKWVWWRAGYQTAPSESTDLISRLSLGAGVRLKGWKLDYAWIPRGELGDEQRVSLQVGFGLTPDERRDMARQLDQAIDQRTKEKAAGFFSQGEKASRSGDWKMAQKNLSTALLWDPQNKAAKDLLALADNKVRFAEAQRLSKEAADLASEGQWLDAALKWEQALKIDPKLEKARQGVATARRKIGTARDASTPDSVAQKAYDNGVRLYLEGQYAAALREWEKAKKSGETFRQIDEYILKAKNMKLTQDYQALQEKSGSTNAMSDMLSQEAYTWYSLGQIDKAIETWRKVLVLDPNNADAKGALRDADERKRLAGNDLSLPPVNRVTELNADALRYYRAGELERAAAAWKKALELEPRNVWIQNYLARVRSELAEKETSDR